LCHLCSLFTIPQSIIEQTFRDMHCVTRQFRCVSGRAAWGSRQVRLRIQTTKLANIDLRGTKVTDAGLAQLPGLTNLSAIYLSNTQISAAALLCLNGLIKVADVGVGAVHGSLTLGGESSSRLRRD
jgi:hypothetical protein